MWPLALLLLIAGTCSAQVSEQSSNDKPAVIAANIDKVPPITKGPPYTEEPVGPEGELLSVRPPDTCREYVARNASIDLEIPHKCCHYNTWSCYFKHNGMCKRQWDTGSCDYTVNVCYPWFTQTHWWFCTCCASCDGPNGWNECKQKGGRCARTCYSHEYFAFWDKCSHPNCRCCKKLCPQETCANGKGRCLHSSQKCPRGYYVSSEPCKGWNCKCCVPCKHDPDCGKKQGFCEWNERKCPIGYLSEKCHCPDKECRCCYRQKIVGPPSGSIAVKMSQQIELGGGEPPPVDPIENETSETDGQGGQDRLAAEAEAMEGGGDE